MEDYIVSFSIKPFATKTSMVLKEYENMRGWRKLRYHLPALYVIATFGGLMYMLGNRRTSFPRLKKPEIVPVYDEQGKFVGMTHPTMVEHTEKLRAERLQRDSLAEQ